MAEEVSGWKLVPVEDTEEMWSGLARQIVLWRDMQRPTGSALYHHLLSSGYEVPDWLRELIPDTSHVPSKGAVCGAIYRAMLSASPEPPVSVDREEVVKVLEEARAHVEASSKAEHMMDGFSGIKNGEPVGRRVERPSDGTLARIDSLLARMREQKP